MIRKISRGWRVAGLVRYLMGPGRFNEHTGQRVVASWDEEPSLHQPPRTSDGEFDLDELAAELADPALAAGISQIEPPRAKNGKVPRGPVWHCSLRNHPDDRVLSDAEWAEIVTELMDRTGIARRGDIGGCRWVAIRHADDHVHIAAMLVRQDNGRRVHPRNDYYIAGDVCRKAEKRLGLIPTPAADRTALPAATRAEIEKAVRRGQHEPSRVWLRRVVRIAAVQAREPEEFFRRLADLGLLCRPRERPPGQLVGYSVAAPGDVTARGRPVWYSGGSLGRDLTLPKLLGRWESAGPPSPPIPPAAGERSAVGQAERDAATADAASAIEHATATVASGEDTEATGIAHAAGDMITAVTSVTTPREGGEEQQRWEPANVFGRAAGTPNVVQPPRLGPVAGELRRAAWRLIAVRSLTGGSGGGELVLALIVLIMEIAAYQERQGRLAQASAARRSAGLLREQHRSRRDGEHAAAATTGRRTGAHSGRPTVRTAGATRPHLRPTAASPRIDQGGRKR